MALSYATYQADGNTKQFAITFGYLRRNHVFVFVDGTMTGYKWVSPTNIEIDPAPAENASVKIQRLTDKVNRITDFADGQTLLAGDLDAATLQNFYLVQEMIDGITDGVLTGDVAITNPPLPGNPITSQEIQNLLNEAARNSPVVDQLLNDTLVNSQAIVTETQNRIDALTAETAARVAGIAAEAAARQQALTDEQNARIAQINSLQLQLDADVSNLTALSDDLTDEVNARIAAVSAVNDAVTQEVTDRIAAVDGVASALAQEVTDRINAVSANASNLAQEILDRQAEDTALDGRIDAVVASVGGNSALLATEQQARIDGDNALASQLSVIQTEVDGNAAQIASEQQARSDADSAIVSDVTALTARVGDNEAGILSANEAIATESSARATAISGLQTQIDGNAASISSNATAISDETSARVSALSALQTQVDDNEAAILSEITARSDADSAFTLSLNALTARVGDNEADIITVNEAVATESSARATAISGLQTQIDGNFASIAANATAISDETSARVSAISAIQTQVDDNEAAITTEATARSDADSAFTLSLNALTARVGDNEADIITVNEAISTEASARATAISGLQTQVNNNAAGIASNATAISDETSARVSALSALQTQVDGNEAGLISEQTARTNADSAQASDISALTTRMGDAEAGIVSNQSAISTESSARASAINGLQAQIDDNEAAVIAEASARADADSVQASQITGLTTRMGAAEGNIISNAGAISTETSARTSQFNSLSAEIENGRLRLFNGDFEQGKQGWSSAYTSDGLGEDFPASDAFGFTPTRPDGGAALRVTGYAYLASSWALKLDDERTYRYRIRVRTVTDSTNGNVTAASLYIVRLDSNGDYISSSFTSGVTVLEADGWTTIEYTFNKSQIGGSASYARPMFLIGGNGASVQSNGTMEIQEFVVDDITDVEEANALAASLVASEQTARVNADNALASDVTGLQTRMGDAEADILSNQTAISDESEARASQVDVLTAAYKSADLANAIALQPPAHPYLDDLGVVLDSVYNVGCFVTRGAEDSFLTIERNNTTAQYVGFAETGPAEWTQARSEIDFQSARYVVIDIEAVGHELDVFTRWRDVTGRGTNWSEYAPILDPLSADSPTIASLAPGERRVIVFDLHGGLADGGTEHASGGFDRFIFYCLPTAAPVGAQAKLHRWALVGSDSAGFRDIEAQLVNEASVRASADSAQASDISGLTTRMGDAEADILSNQTAISDETGARTSSFNSLRASLERGTGQALNSNSDMMDGSEGWHVSYASSGWHSGTENFDYDPSSNRHPFRVVETPEGRGLDFDSMVEGDVSGWFYSQRAYPVDTSRRYRVRVRYYVHRAGGTVYSSIVTLDDDFDFISGGAGTHRYGPDIAKSASPAGAIVEHDWIITGEGDLNNQFRPGTKYIRLGGILNYNGSGANSHVTVLECSIADVDEAQDVLDNASAQVASEQSARVSADTAQASDISSLQTRMGDAEAGIVSNSTAISNETGARVSAVNSLTTRVGDAEADITAVQSVASDAQGRAQAMYGLRVNANGHVSGFGLSNDGTTSKFAVLADEFLVVDPSNPANLSSPFAVIGGVTYIVNAKIGTAVIDDAAITNLKIGNLEIGSEKFQRKAVINADGEEGYLSHGTGLWNDYVTDDLTLVTVPGFTVKEDSKVIGRLTFTPKDLSTTLALKFRAYNTQSSYQLKLMLAIFRGSTKIFEEVLYDPVLTGTMSYTDLPNILSKKLRFEDTSHAAGTYDYRAAILGVQSANGIGDGVTPLDVGWYIDDIGAQLELLEARDN